MSDYIKKEDAINEIKRFGGYIDDDMIYRINTAIFRIPSADVTENVRLSPITTVTDNKPTEWVEVVRCKDCEHHEELLYNHDGKVLCWVHGLDVVVDGNGYCNYGERKEQEHE